MKTKLKILFIFLALITASVTVRAERHIVVDKSKLRLYVIDGRDTVFKAPVSVGVNFGNKTRRGDHKTPEGTFTIWMIQDSHKWPHDFHDGKGVQKGAYGPWFFRLKTPKWTTIGIHGTCYPETVGTRASEGCVRLRNEDLLKLKEYVFKGMKVTITPD